MYKSLLFYKKWLLSLKKYIKDYKVKDVYLVGGACSFDESEEIFKKELGLNIYKPYMPVYITPLGIALAGMKEWTTPTCRSGRLLGKYVLLLAHIFTKLFG